MNQNTESQSQIPYGIPSGLYGQNEFLQGNNNNMRDFSMNNTDTPNNNGSPMYGHVGSIPSQHPLANHIGNMGHGFIDISTNDAINNNGNGINNMNLPPQAGAPQFMNSGQPYNMEQQPRSAGQPFPADANNPNQPGVPPPMSRNLSAHNTNSNTSSSSPYVAMNEMRQSRMTSDAGETLKPELQAQQQSVPFNGQPPSLRANPNIPSALLSYPVRKYISGMAILRFHELINMINNSVGHISKLEYWQNFVHEMFTPNASLRYSKTSTIDFRQFDFLISLVPILFVTLWKLGVVRIEVSPQQLKSEVLSNGCIFISCPRATFTYHYPDGSYITHFVQFKGIFTPGLKLEFGDLYMHSFVPGIEWNSLERLLSNQDASFEIFQKLSHLTQNGNAGDNSNDNNSTVSGNNNNNDNKVKTEDEQKKNGNDVSNRKHNENNENNTDDILEKGQANEKLLDKDLNEETDKNVPPNFNAITQLRSYFSVFRNVSVFGSQEGLMRVMQVSTVMSALKNLRVYQKTHNIHSPLEALNLYVQENYHNLNPAMSTAGNGAGYNNNNIGGNNNNASGSPSSAPSKTLAGNPSNTGMYMSPSSSSQTFGKNPINSQDSKNNSNEDINSNSQRPGLKRRRQSAVSPHSLRDTLSPNHQSLNESDEYDNIRKKSRNQS